MPDLHALGEGLFKGLVVCQHSDAHHQHHQHDSQLEVGVQGCCKHLGCCQSQRLQQHYAVPEPEPVPAATSHWVKVCEHLLMPTSAVAATLCCVSPRLCAGQSSCSNLCRSHGACCWNHRPCRPSSLPTTCVQHRNSWAENR